ncbi:DUF3836 domain-containing protein [Bacteroides timonensis]|uniref:DUF3836 domain-containing protein n=1 Tax=Bacteroides timonensis TaxID=1470345 RepID=UPI0004BB9464|nr:DUF3836 domain-containing protein [Bacteroides timonensis]
MKTLVMTVIFAVTAVVNAFGGNNQKDFAYNEVMNGEQVESQLVFKVEGGKFLQNHLKYNFTYDAQGRIVQKEALKWSEIEQAYERYYCLNYSYSEIGTDVEYALWSDKTNAYSDVKEKSVYLFEGDAVSYLSYKWDEKENDWNLLVEHSTANEDMQLLAID